MPLSTLNWHVQKSRFCTLRTLEDYQCFGLIPRVQKEFTYRFHYGLQGRFFSKNEKKQMGGDFPPLSMGTRVKKIHQSQIKITHVKSRCCKILSGKYIIQVSIIYLEIIFTESSRTILINLENNITNLILESPKDIIPKTKLHHQYIQLQIFSN